MAVGYFPRVDDSAIPRPSGIPVPGTRHTSRDMTGARYASKSTTVAGAKHPSAEGFGPATAIPLPGDAEMFLPGEMRKRAEATQRGTEQNKIEQNRTEELLWRIQELELERCREAAQNADAAAELQRRIQELERAAREQEKELASLRSQNIAAEQSLRREKEASAFLQQMLEQERLAKAALLAAREEEAEAIDGEKGALLARSRELATRVERLEDRMEGLEQEKEVVEIDRDAIAVESEVLVERLGEAEQTVEMLRQENVNLEAELLAAQRSRDTYWTHSIALYQDKAKLEEQLNLLNSISSSLNSGGRSKATASTAGRRTQTPTRAAAAASSTTRRLSLPFPNPKSSSSSFSQLNAFAPPLSLELGSLRNNSIGYNSNRNANNSCGMSLASSSIPQLVKQQLAFGTVYECPPLLASASMSASMSAAASAGLGMTNYGGFDMVRAATSTSSCVPLTATVSGATGMRGGFDSAGMRRSTSSSSSNNNNSSAPCPPPLSSLLTRSLSERRASPAGTAGTASGGNVVGVYGSGMQATAGSLASVNEGPE